MIPISDILNGLLVLIAGVSAAYGYKQIREARKSRLLEPYFEIDRRLQEQKPERATLFDLWPGDLSDEWRNSFEKIAITFDVLGALVREDMIYRPMVFKIYYDVIIKTWDCVKPRILSERNHGTKAKTYMADFEYLYEQAKAYAKKNGLDYPSVKPPANGAVSMKQINH